MTIVILSRTTKLSTILPQLSPEAGKQSIQYTDPKTGKPAGGYAIIEENSNGSKVWLDAPEATLNALLKLSAVTLDKVTMAARAVDVVKAEAELAASAVAEPVEEKPVVIGGK